MVSPSVQKPYRNSLLSCLPARDLKQLKPHLVPIVLKRNQILHAAGERVKTIYFLEEGICSIVANMENGNSVEVGIIGRDNFVGLSAVLGTGLSINRNFMQIPGAGYSLEASLLIELFSSNGSSELRLCLQRGIQALFIQTAQTAACNRVHDLEERLCRWLLMCHDRVQADLLEITHEFLATMLGTRRSTVTVAAGILHKAGLIEYTRGHVKIMNRAGLEDVACECYRVVHDEYARLGLL